MSIHCIYIFQRLIYAKKNLQLLNSDARCYTPDTCMISIKPCNFSKKLNTVALYLHQPNHSNSYLLGLQVFENKQKFLIKSCFYIIDEYVPSSLYCCVQTVIFSMFLLSYQLFVYLNFISVASSLRYV